MSDLLDGISCIAQVAIGHQGEGVPGECLGSAEKPRIVGCERADGEADANADEDPDDDESKVGEKLTHFGPHSPSLAIETRPHASER